MNFSSDKFVISSKHPISEIAERLYENTFIRNTLVRVRTAKLFIGEVTDDDFYLIAASRSGALCTLNGEFKTEGGNTIIKIETKMHRAFVILFNCWGVFVLVAPVIGHILNRRSQGFPLAGLPLLLLAVVGARLLLHFVYTRVRNKSIRQIEALIA